MDNPYETPTSLNDNDEQHHQANQQQQHLGETDKQTIEELKQQLDDDSWAGVKEGAAVGGIGGFLFGVAIGTLGVVLQFNQYLSDCSRYRTPGACDALTFEGCRWIKPDQEADTVVNNQTNSTFNEFCAFPDYRTTNCTDYFSQTSCRTVNDGDSCYWRHHENKCAHVVGWSSGQQGLIAGMQIIGAMIGSLSAGSISNKIGRRKSLFTIATLTLLACFFFTLGWGLKESLGLLVFAELLVGLASGAATVVCPMYCGEIVPDPAMEQKVGLVFQFAITLAILVVDAVGLALDPENDTSNNRGHLQSRFYYVIGLQWFAAVMMLVIGFYAPESPLWLKQQSHRAAVNLAKGDELVRDGAEVMSPAMPGGDASALDRSLMNSARSMDAEEMASQNSSPAGAKEDQGAFAKERKVTAKEAALHTVLGNTDEEKEESSSMSDLFTRENSLHLAIGFCLGCSLQFSGINAIIVYFPKISGQLGISPLLGNFFLGLWNFITCFIPLGLVRKFSCRQLYISMMFVAFGACVLTAIGVFPGIFEEQSDGQKIVSMLGIFLFILAFESGIGSVFFILGTEIFPPRVRALGCSYTLCVSFVFNAIINFFFAPFVEAASGGPSGNQNQGLGIAFILFSLVAIVSAVFLKLKMPLTNSEVKKLALEKRILEEAS